MPPIYAKMDNGKWRRSTYNERNDVSRADKRFDTTDNEDLPEWITECHTAKLNIRSFLEGQDFTSFPRGDHLTAKHVVYFLVVKDSKYAVQIYIGEARGGIMDRWVTNVTSHCRAIRDVVLEKCRCQMLKFSDMWYRCDEYGYQSVDCYLAAAWLSGSNMALFVIPSDEENMGKMQDDLIRRYASSTENGLNVRQDNRDTGQQKTPKTPKIAGATQHRRGSKIQLQTTETKGDTPP